MNSLLSSLAAAFENAVCTPGAVAGHVRQALEHLRQKQIAIYPAGSSGRLFQSTLAEHGIRPAFFLDSNAALKEINEIPVLSPESLKEADRDCLVAVCANLASQVDFFRNKVRELAPDLQCIDAKNLARLLRAPKCLKRLEAGIPFDLVTCEHCGFERKACAIASAYLKKIGRHDSGQAGPRSVRFDWFGYIVSQTCTLRCEQCCEQIPYLKDKGFVPAEDIVNDVKKIAESVEFLNFVELIGGEPFLYPKIESLISSLLGIKNIGYVKSFTNGTVVPSDDFCRVMQNPRFMLHVSNYEKTAPEKLLENIRATREKLEDSGIRYLFTQDFEWLDFSSFDRCDMTPAQIEKSFRHCFLKNCHRLYKGKLYLCPHQYAGVQRSRLTAFPHECIDIRAVPAHILAGQLDQFKGLRSIDACACCTLPFNARPVPAGRQMTRESQGEI